MTSERTAGAMRAASRIKQRMIQGGLEINEIEAIIDRLEAENIILKKTVTGLVEALIEIKKREGAFSRDPLTHAENTIESMAGIAEAALAKAQSRQ